APPPGLIAGGDYTLTGQLLLRLGLDHGRMTGDAPGSVPSPGLITGVIRRPLTGQLPSPPALITGVMTGDADGAAAPPTA
ncbi:hypothetical protein CYMTET_36206, partial [Cymbomonas tetramitiformis]